MLSRKSQQARKGQDGSLDKNKRNGTPQQPPRRQFYWHRPLGAAEDCRRLIVQETKKSTTAAWALPLSMERVLCEIDENPRPGRLDTVEFDGDSWDQVVTEREWHDICRRIRRRHPRKVVFYGGVSDNQRSFLLRLISSFIQAVELYDSGCHDETLRVLVDDCERLAEFRMFHCASLSQTHTAALLFMVYNRPLLRALVLSDTSFMEPQATAQRFCLALEETAALDEAEFGGHYVREDVKEYLSVITKIHRMRHYYYACHQHTDLSAFGIADNALGVVQNWWRSTHRPDMKDEQHFHHQLATPKTTAVKTATTLTRLSSNASRGSC